MIESCIKKENRAKLQLQERKNSPLGGHELTGNEKSVRGKG